MFKEQDMDAVILNHNIDSAFITQIEQQNQHIKFKRIDADVEDALKEDVDEKELDEIKTSLTDLFRKTLNKENLEVHVEKLKDAKISSIITLSEESRRMQDMMKMYVMPGMDPNMFGAPAQVLTLNANNTLVKYLFEMCIRDRCICWTKYCWISDHFSEFHTIFYCFNNLSCGDRFPDLFHCLDVYKRQILFCSITWVCSWC